MTPSEQSVAPCICGDLYCDIPFGYCHCRCGNPTLISPRNDSTYKWVNGLPRTFVHGHNRVKLRSFIVQPENEPFRYIALTKNQISIVDTFNYERLNSRLWVAHWYKKAGTFYADRLEKRDGRIVHVTMQSEVISVPEGYVVDHISNNTLDNRIQNLRPATRRQNSINAKLQKNNTTGHVGISWDKSMNKYHVRITSHGVTYDLGWFSDFDEAVQVRRKKEEELFGEFAPHLKRNRTIPES